LQAELAELEQKAQEMRELVQQTEAELEGLAPERTRTLVSLQHMRECTDTDV
jgi:hypothetical protein